ncbi:helix-turn-helix domain-containing protein [Massilia sp. 9096]|jgi:DNA-binding HxlR family transcriptional regulator|uniref:winged helix-turn-helix transcriptional regulator n=1 Tax=Massilia sp. 9096 TaxID=1500894 RepID=UPI0005606045|nr:helix-turn-helix domain-containing protein [Massilia sp. 9096]
MDIRCGLDVALAVVGGKWKPLIVFHLAGGPRRFGELRRLVAGVSEKMLIQQLRELVEDGLITRHDFQEVPPRVEYRMTDFGHSLAQALTPLCAWGNAQRARVEAIARGKSQATAAALAEE